jgi:putative acyl-CoA dehydrogenase
LDVLRAASREPDTLQAFFNELNKAKGEDQRFDQHLSQLQKQFTQLDDIEYRARHIVEQMALGLQGSLLIQAGNSDIADAFCAGRLSGNSGNTYGMLPKGINVNTLIDRCRITG